MLADSAGGKGTDDVNRAKQMARLAEHGQFNLRDATAVAEKHVTGTALEATCGVRPGGPPGEAEQQATGKRLVHAICCFAGGKIQAAQVDGVDKKVIDVQERKSLNRQRAER